MRALSRCVRGVTLCFIKLCFINQYNASLMCCECVCVCVCVCIYVRMHVHRCVCVCVCVCMRAHACMHAYVHVSEHMLFYYILAFVLDQILHCSYYT